MNDPIFLKLHKSCNKNEEMIMSFLDIICGIANLMLIPFGYSCHLSWNYLNYILRNK
jgi:hypothetical protein